MKKIVIGEFDSFNLAHDCLVELREEEKICEKEAQAYGTPHKDLRYLIEKTRTGKYIVFKLQKEV